MSGTHFHSHSAHVRKTDSPSLEDLPPSEHPANVLQVESEYVHQLLEELDDVIFTAIAGSNAALRRAQTLWPQTVAALGWQQVEESREQYLRYAIDITQRLEKDDIRSPDQALAALEIISLLTKH